MSGPNDEMVTISRPTTALDAEMVRDFLVQHGVEARLTGVAPALLGAWFGLGPFAQRIQVPRSQAQKAIEVIGAMREYDAFVDDQTDTLVPASEVTRTLTDAAIGAGPHRAAPVTTTPPLAPRLKRIAAGIAFVVFPLAGLGHYYARNTRAAAMLFCLSILSWALATAMDEGVFLAGVIAAGVADFIGSMRAVDITNGVARQGAWSAIQAWAPLGVLGVLVFGAVIPVSLKYGAPAWYLSEEMAGVCEGLHRCDLVANRSSSCVTQLQSRFEQVEIDPEDIRQLERCARSVDADCEGMRFCAFGLDLRPRTWGLTY